MHDKNWDTYSACSTEIRCLRSALLCANAYLQINFGWIRLLLLLEVFGRLFIWLLAKFYIDIFIYNNICHFFEYSSLLVFGLLFFFCRLHIFPVYISLRWYEYWVLKQLVRHFRGLSIISQKCKKDSCETDITFHSSNSNKECHTFPQYIQTMEIRYKDNFDKQNDEGRKRAAMKLITT